MKDTFQLREDATASWLAFKKELGILLTAHNEEMLRLAYLHAFAEGWGRGSELAHKMAMDCIDRTFQ